MANLHHTYRGDSFHPSSTSVPRDTTVLPPPAPVNPSSLPIPDEQHPPPPRFAMAPSSTAPTSTPPPGAFKRCGGRLRGVCVGCFSDPEMKRRRRVAGCKAYGVERKVKASLRRGIRWFKRKCSGIFRV